MKVHTWSPSANAFNVTADDSIDIDEKLFENLIIESSRGKKITSDNNGSPIAVDDIQSTAERVISARLNRDAELARSGWIIDRHRDELEAGIATTLPPERYAELQAYRQQLRDWPAQPGWPDIDMPPQPEWLAPLLK